MRPIKQTKPRIDVIHKGNAMECALASFLEIKPDECPDITGKDCVDRHRILREFMRDRGYEMIVFDGLHRLPGMYIVEVVRRIAPGEAAYLGLSIYRDGHFVFSPEPEDKSLEITPLRTVLFYPTNIAHFRKVYVDVQA